MVIVTLVCSVGVAGAVAVIIAGRAQRSETPAPLAEGASVRARVAEQVRQVCAVLAAGFVGGFLGFGLGGRLLMRVLAATSPDAQGRLTEADEVVGEVTAGGTVFLVVLLTVLGLVGAVAYHALRALLPARSLAAGAVVGAIGGGLLIRPSDLLDPGNRDFEILEPTWLAVATCVALIAVGALATAVLVDRWVPRWPKAAVSVRGIAGLVPLVALAVIPLGASVVVIVVARTALAGRSMPRAGRRWGQAVVGSAAAIGGIWIAASGLAILT